MDRENDKYWICDQCDEKIQSLGDGWIEWLVTNEDGSFKAVVVRILHNNMTTGHNCRYDVAKGYSQNN